MGKKDNTKAKEKKMKRKEKEMKMNAGWFAVKKANEQVDPLAVLPSFKKYQKNDLNLSLETKKIDQLDLKTKEWVIDLMERNMKEIYAQSEHGWDEEGKLNELMDNAAWYLIAKDADTDVPVAYSHFRYDIEDGDDVLFCYEIQLEESVRRKGLGKFMMKVLELIMMKSNLLKIILLVFKHNQVGCKFFKDALKYEIDRTSPSDSDDYEILSRYNLMEKKKRDADADTVAAPASFVERKGGCCSGC